MIATSTIPKVTTEHLFLFQSWILVWAESKRPHFYIDLIKKSLQSNISSPLVLWTFLNIFLSQSIFGRAPLCEIQTFVLTLLSFRFRKYSLLRRILAHAILHLHLSPPPPLWRRILKTCLERKKLELGRAAWFIVFERFQHPSFGSYSGAICSISIQIYYKFDTISFAYMTLELTRKVFDTSVPSASPWPNLLIRLNYVLTYRWRLCWPLGVFEKLSASQKHSCAQPWLV